MGKKDSAEGKKNNAVEAIRTLTEAHKKRIRAVIANKAKVKIDQDFLKDDVKAIADELGLKPAKLNEVIALIMLEEGTGGAILEKNTTIDLAEQVLTTSNDDVEITVTPVE